jgi:selenide,water dikinase
MLPAGCYRNRDHYLPLVSNPDSDSDTLLPLFDPQTSGGLLIALAPKDAERFLEEAGQRGIFARRIGDVLPLRTNYIQVL